MVGVAAWGEATPVERGLEIFTQADRRGSGFNDFAVALEMTLRTKSGKESRRDLEIRQLENEHEGDRVLLVFESPASIRGTALLSHSRVTAADDQWLYLPALKRVKKIAARNRSGPFVGSEFSFEDLTVQDVSEYTYEYLGDETLDGLEHFVVARYPKDEFSGYTREVFWLDQAEYRTIKIVYYDQRPDPLKVLTVSDYVQYEGRFWKPHRMLMTNLRSDKSTELVWSEYRFNNGLTEERDFSVASLRRAR
jgi:hypothetical protein